MESFKAELILDNTFILYTQALKAKTLLFCRLLGIDWTVKTKFVLWDTGTQRNSDFRFLEETTLGSIRQKQRNERRNKGKTRGRKGLQEDRKMGVREYDHLYYNFALLFTVTDVCQSKYFSHMKTINITVFSHN